MNLLIQSQTEGSITDEKTSTYESCEEAPSSDTQNGEESGGNPATLDADLALVIERWDDLPEAVRAGIVAMVRASGDE